MGSAAALPLFALPLLASSCEGMVSGHSEDAGVEECCLELRCAPGQECFECTCRDSECCAALSCQEDQQICVNCACVYAEDDGDGGASDEDHDGFGAEADCDDGDPAVNPGAAETCNEIDDDCDGSMDEDTCPDQNCCGDECRECCDDAHCDDGDACTRDVCDSGQCRHDRPVACDGCCRDLCEDLHARDCASEMNGDCGDFCSALSAVEGDSGCSGESRDYQTCLGACDDVCEADCDDLGRSLANCVANWCVRQWNNPNCQTLASSFNF